MKKILYALCAVVLFFSCSSPDEVILSNVEVEMNTKGSIVGSVSDRTTGEPVATVNVTITPDGASTVTGSDGSFSFNSLAEGSYTLTITKEGYKQNSSTVSVHGGEPTPAHLLIERVPAVVTADRDSLDFGANQSANTLSFNIVNPGYVDLAWEIEEHCEWITEIKPLKGVLAYGKTEGIVVVIDRKKLASGKNEAVIVVRSSNGSSEVKVLATGETKALPTLNALDVTDISATSVTLNGEITTAGFPAYTERGFVYSTSSVPNNNVDESLPRVTAPITDNAAYSCHIDGLTLGVSYFVRAYAVNSLGMAYSSNQVTFITAAELATLTVDAATNVDVVHGEATLNGTIVTAGDPAYVERGFVCNTRPNPTIDHTKVVVNGTGTGQFNVDISNLDIETDYYVRAYVINEINDVVYSTNEIVVSTKAILPQVTTLDIESADISAGTATLRGTIVSAGEPAYTQRGFVYSTLPEPTIYDNKIVANGAGITGSFSLYATGLPKTTCYVRAYAVNRGGVIYGEEKSNVEWINLPAAGLAVQKKDIGRSDWSTINEMCENSMLGGYFDWRLPTKAELMTLYTNRGYIGGFKTAQSSYPYYWSSSEDDGGYWYGLKGYYCVNFYNGNLSGYSEDRTFSGRCVRTLKE